MARLASATLIAILVILSFGANITSSHHTGVACGAASNLATGDARCLPLMDRSWAVSELRATGQLTWCMNNRASTYPNLRTQIREVLANHESSIQGIDWIEIGGIYETPTAALNAGCQVQMNMPEVHGCPECGGWIHYLNRPVLIEYNPHRGITFFQTTISHEVEHLYGVHEHYDDANFLSHRNTYGIWAHGLNRSPGTATDAPTVMDFGTGVWRMTAYDVKYTCQSIDRQSAIFRGCGAVQEPEPVVCVGQPDSFGNRYNSCNIWWEASDGNLFLLTVPYPETGQLGWWLFSACSSNGWRYTGLNKTWLQANNSMYPDALRYANDGSGIVVKVPAC